MKLADECQSSAVHQSESESFHRIFWEQQMMYNSPKNKASMQWHLTLIRWCLFIRSRSSTTYDGMRAYFNIPSNWTLFDHTHYKKHGLDVNKNTVEQLVAKATKLGSYSCDHKSFVGLLHDEVRIKSDLVHNKTTGKIIGYIKLDKVSNELLQLE